MTAGEMTAGVMPTDEQRTEQETVMDDVIFLAVSVAFFAATFGIAFLFDRLLEHK